MSIAEDITETRTVGAGILTSTIHPMGNGNHEISVRIDTPTGASFEANRWGTESFLSPLTPCCHTFAKGMEDCICCRSCFNVVDDVYGDSRELADVASANSMVNFILGDMYGIRDSARLAGDITAAVRAEMDRLVARITG